MTEPEWKKAKQQLRTIWDSLRKAVEQDQLSCFEQDVEDVQGNLDDDVNKARKRAVDKLHDRVSDSISTIETELNEVEMALDRLDKVQ